MERKVLLAFRGIVDSLFKGKDVFVMGGYLLEKEHLMFLERVHRVYPHLTRDDTLIMLLVRMRFRNTEIARMLHVKPASFRLAAEVEAEEETGRFRHGFKVYDNEVVGTWTC